MVRTSLLYHEIVADLVAVVFVQSKGTSEDSDDANGLSFIFFALTKTRS